MAGVERITTAFSRSEKFEWSGDGQKRTPSAFQDTGGTVGTNSKRGKNKKKTTIKIDVKPPWKVAMGHQPHTTGSGIHKDRRTKRKRTRGSQRRWAIKDQWSMETRQMLVRCDGLLNRSGLNPGADSISVVSAYHAAVAQLVEHKTENLGVTGSIPVRSTYGRKRKTMSSLQRKWH